MSVLLETMSPLILASELAWGESDSEAGASPAALRPLSRMSEEENQVGVQWYGRRFDVVCSSRWAALAHMGSERRM